MKLIMNHRYFYQGNKYPYYRERWNNRKHSFDMADSFWCYSLGGRTGQTSYRDENWGENTLRLCSVECENWTDSRGLSEM